MKTLFILALTFLIAGCPAPVAQKDFFECGVNNTLVACPVGETPNASHGDCRSVGDGDTTLTDGDCS